MHLIECKAPSQSTSLLVHMQLHQLITGFPPHVPCVLDSGTYTNKSVPIWEPIWLNLTLQCRHAQHAYLMLNLQNGIFSSQFYKCFEDFYKTMKYYKNDSSSSSQIQAISFETSSNESTDTKPRGKNVTCVIAIELSQTFSSAMIYQLQKIFGLLRTCRITV